MIIGNTDWRGWRTTALLLMSLTALLGAAAMITKGAPAWYAYAIAAVLIGDALVRIVAVHQLRRIQQANEIGELRRANMEPLPPPFEGYIPTPEEQAEIDAWNNRPQWRKDLSEAETTLLTDAMVAVLDVDVDPVRALAAADRVAAAGQKLRDIVRANASAPNGRRWGWPS